ncbi:MAG: hypothetical protein H6732_00065 [Alphaproteobacteria bacterium]|nr:hypothetical protein [Alphaproteobacteria bacterium]
MSAHAPVRSVLAVLALGTIATVLGLHAACSYPPDCTYGVSPVPGSTSVPLDVEIVLRGSTLPADALPPTEGILLRDLTTGEDLPVDAALEGDRVRVRPKARLAPGHAYELRGVDEDRVLGWHRQTDDLGATLPVATRFTTGPGFALLGSLPTDQDSGLLRTQSALLAFSEPVDAEAMADHVQGVAEGGGLVQPWSLQRVPRRSHLLEVIFAEPVFEVLVTAGAPSRRGGTTAKDRFVLAMPPRAFEQVPEQVGRVGDWPATPLATLSGDLSCPW